MSSNFERLHEISNEAYAENLSILSQKLANPLLYPALHFLIGIPFHENLGFVNSELVAGSGEQDIEQGILPKPLTVDCI